MPLGTQTGRVLKVLARLIGTPYRIDDLSDQPKTDHDLPCGNGNSWCFRFDKEHARLTSADDQDLSWGNMVLIDGAGQRWSWPIHAEMDTEDGVEVAFASNPLGVAICRRLLQVFGGQMECDDGKEDKPGNKLSRSPLHALMPPMIPGADRNERWYRFQNLLKNQTVIKPEEIAWATDRAAYKLSNRSLFLSEWLASETQRTRMEQETASTTATVSRPRQRL